MKKWTWLAIIASLFFLVACDAKESKGKTESSSSEAQVVKTQVFDLKLSNGQTQRQTLVYKGDSIQKLTLQNPIELTDQIREAIAEVGLDETKRLILESMATEELYQNLGEISGLTYELQFLSEEQLVLIFTLDVPQLDGGALARSEMFKGSGLEDITKLKSEQYLKRLEAYGAQPVSVGGESQSETGIIGENK